MNRLKFDNFVAGLILTVLALTAMVGIHRCTIAHAETVCTANCTGPSVAGWTGLAYQKAPVDNGDSGAAVTIDWNAGNYQKVTLTDNAAISFVDPPGPTGVMLCMIQDSGGGNDVTWANHVEWEDGSEPAWDTTGDLINCATFFFEGVGYLGQGMIAYSQPQRVASYVSDTVTAMDGVVGINSGGSASFTALLAITPNLVGDEMDDIGGPADTLQVVLQSSSTTDEFAATVLPLACFDTDDGQIAGTPGDATLTIDGTGSDNPLAGDFDIHVVSAAPADPASFVAGDLLTFDTESLDSIAFGSINTSGANTFTIPAAAIDTDGKTCVGIVYGDYLAGTFSGSWASSEISVVTFDSTAITLDVPW